MSTFQDRIEAELERLKRHPTAADSLLPVCLAGKQVATLEPVGWADRDRPDSIAQLAEWRAQAADAFPSQFTVTLAGTERWLLKGLLEVPDRALFWVKDQAGTKLGHVGLFRFDYERRQCELDNIIRGVSGVMPGLMQASIETLMDWTFKQLDLDEILLTVFGHNDRAIRLYERSGFVEKYRRPLKKVVEGAVTSWVDSAEGESHERHFVTMGIERNKWNSLHVFQRSAA